MSTQKTLLTAEEFYLFCCQNDGRYELVDGEVVEMAPANEQHCFPASRCHYPRFSTRSRRIEHRRSVPQLF